jgi:GT2 family glycosyltransferase
MSPQLRHRSQIRQNETKMNYDINEITSIPWYKFRSNNISFKREFFATVGGFDDSLAAASCEDTELAFRLNDRQMYLYYIGYALAYHYHPMNAEQFMRKAAAYGVSMASWYKKEPRARHFIAHYYGLPAKEISRLRYMKYAVHRALFGGRAFTTLMKFAHYIRKINFAVSEWLYEELYKAEYRCTFCRTLNNRKRNRVCADFPMSLKQLSVK